MGRRSDCQHYGPQASSSSRDESRRPRMLERAKGVEPLPETWRASILPLNYTRIPVLLVPQAPQQSPIGCSFVILS